MGTDTRFRFFHLAALLHMRNRIVNPQRECPNGLIVEMLQSTWRRACVQYCVSPVSIHVFIDYSHDIKVELDFSAQMITTLKQNPPKKTINQKLWWIKFMRRNGIPCVCVCVAMGKRWGGRVIFDAYWITHAVVSISVISDRERERSNVFWI
jgi:hypothetical protein